MVESIPYVECGRTHQKQRTRDALVATAQELIVRGVIPTVEDTAAEARISRTTAYRYFPNQAALLVAAYPQVEIRSLLEDDAPKDPEERFMLAMERLTELVADVEAQERAMLRLSLEPDDAKREPLLLRQGRAISWLEDVLEPLRDDLGTDGVRRLAYAVRSASGIEALVWLTDIAGLSRPEALEIMRWNARSLFRAARSERASDETT